MSWLAFPKGSFKFSVKIIQEMKRLFESLDKPSSSPELTPPSIPAG